MRDRLLGQTRRKIATVPGNHSLRNAGAVEAAVAAWLPRVLRGR